MISILFSSGVAGLGYEVVWTRMLSVALGAEMMAVLGVVAGFFGGLAIGAFALDRFLRNAPSPALAYAALEGAIGCWGLVSIWLLPDAARMSALMLGAEPSPALLWSISFLMPALLLLPATACMGGTLTALERLTRDALGNEHESAGVYGANTAGAVLGAGWRSPIDKICSVATAWAYPIGYFHIAIAEARTAGGKFVAAP